MITTQGKSAIEDYFDRFPALEHMLEQKKDQKFLKVVRDLADYLMTTDIAVNV
jgi:UTP-glucose-1-phosphate uridylyltransferase